MFIRTLKYILFLFFTSSYIYAQNIFEHQNPEYTSEQINFISFNNNTGYASGNYGLLLKTTDNGINWTQQTIQTKANIMKVIITDISNAFLYDDSSRIYKTTNAGTGWFYAGQMNGRINDMAFINSIKGFVVTDSSVFSTNNGGTNWVQIFNNSVLYKNLSVNFYDSYNGYTSAINKQTNYAYLYKTNNGGINWVEINTAIDGYEISNIRFVNNLIGYCSGSRFSNLFVIKTTNGGLNWAESPVQNASITPNNMYFSNSETGFITSGSRIIKTTNGGLNWNTLLICNSITSSYFKSESEIFLTDSYSRVFFKNNTGQNFDTLLGKNNSVLMRIKSVSENNVWCEGYNSKNYKSTNSGLNWIFDINSNLLNLKGVVFSNVSTGYSISGRGTIMKTTNFGNNWNAVYSTPNELNSLSIYGSQCVWAFGNNEIIKSTDGGNNWTTLPNNNSISAGKFFDEQNGICFNNVYLFKTTDGGSTFNQSITDFVTDYTFVNSTSGYVIINKDTTSEIKQTTNGGIDWIHKSDIDKNISRIEFINSSTGYLLREDRIYRSTNSGITWKYVNLPTRLRVFDFDFMNENTGYVCGDNSMILKIVNGSAIFIQEPIQIVSDFQLLQNYPNPFNSETVIKFIISKPGFTTLKIYDIQGREVSTLIKDYLEPQYYEIKFNAGSLSSGIYFYTIRHNEISVTKKSVLIK